MTSLHPPLIQIGGLRGDVYPPSSVLRRVLFKQAAMRGYAHHFIDHRRILKLAVCQPDLDNAEVLFGGNGYAIHRRQQRLVGGNAVAHQCIRQLPPTILHVLVAHFV